MLFFLSFFFFLFRKLRLIYLRKVLICPGLFVNFLLAELLTNRSGGGIVTSSMVYVNQVRLAKDKG